MAKELDDCTPLELHHEIRSIDCTQERAHDIRRYDIRSVEVEEKMNMVVLHGTN